MRGVSENIESLALIDPHILTGLGFFNLNTMTEQEILIKADAIYDEVTIIRKKEREKLNEVRDLLDSAAELAPLKVGDRIKYKHGKSATAEICKVVVSRGNGKLHFNYNVLPVLKDGSLGKKATRAWAPYSMNGNDFELVKEIEP